MYTNRIVQPHWKKFHVELNVTDREFFVWLFFPNEIGFSISHTEGKVQIGFMKVYFQWLRI